MPDEELDSGLVPEDLVEPEAPPSEDFEQKYKSTDGRLRQMNDALTNAGYQFDANTNQFIQVGGGQQTTYTPPAPNYAPIEDEEDLYSLDGPTLKKRIGEMARTEAGQIVSQVMGALLPIIDSTVDVAVGASTPDWNDLKPGVMERARGLGFNSLAALKGNPQVMQLVIDAERGKRLAGAQMDPKAELARAQRLVAASSASSVGGNGNTPHASGYVFTDDDRDYMKRKNMTEDAYVDFIDGKATINFGGEK